MRVHPTLVPEQNQLATVDGVLNAVMVRGDAVGELVLVGPGAGGAATASAVCADLVDIARSGGAGGPALGVPAEQLSPKPFVPAADITSEWYVRLTVTDVPGVMSDITRILASHGVSIESLVQKASQENDTNVPIVMLTHVAPASVINEAVAEMTALENVQPDFALLRVESFER
jgi:homoserine dehydrogenase